MVAESEAKGHIPRVFLRKSAEDIEFERVSGTRMAKECARV